MRRFLHFLCACLLVVSFICYSIPTQAANNEWSAGFGIGLRSYLIKDGKSIRTIEMDAEPFIQHDRAYIPVRYLANVLGISDSDISWIPQVQQILLVKGTEKVILQINSNIMYINSIPYVIAVSPVVKDGRVYLPARDIAEAFGSTVEWRESEQALLVSYPVQTSRIQTIKYGNCIYTGELLNGVPYGKGKIVCNNGLVVEGYFKNGTPDGEVVMTLSKEGLHYKGEVKDYKFHGYGESQSPSGYYKGSYKESARDGYGEFFSSNGLEYKGNFKDDKYEGYGELSLLDLFKYQGNFKNGLFDGYGQLWISTGDQYWGDFVAGAIHGYGTWLDANGVKYVGEFSNNGMTGKGTLFDSSGRIISQSWSSYSGSLPTYNPSSLPSYNDTAQRNITIQDIEKQREKELNTLKNDLARRGLLGQPPGQALIDELNEKYDTLIQTNSYGGSSYQPNPGNSSSSTYSDEQREELENLTDDLIRRGFFGESGAQILRDQLDELLNQK